MGDSWFTTLFRLDILAAIMEGEVGSPSFRLSVLDILRLYRASVSKPNDFFLVLIALEIAVDFSSPLLVPPAAVLVIVSSVSTTKSGHCCCCFWCS